MRNRKSTPLTRLAAGLALGFAMTGAASAADWTTMDQDAKDAFRHGQIWATFATNPALETRDIDVDVEGDTVTLEGVVETPVEKLLAETIAMSTEGVTEVDNRLRVDPELVVVATTILPARTFAQGVRDASLAARVDSMLLWNEYTDGSDIRVGAKDGQVTLDGVADTQGASDRAAEVARRVMGVRSVVNRLRVDANAPAAADADWQVSDAWIEDKVERTFLYSMLVNSTTLDVEAEDGEVTLTGHVDSPMERELAIQLAQDTRGVERVDAGSVRVL